MPLLIYFNSVLSSIYGQLLSDVSSKLKGVTSQDYNLNTDRLEKFHALSSDTYSDRITFPQNCQCRSSVISTNCSTVGNFKLCECLTSFRVHFVEVL